MRKPIPYDLIRRITEFRVIGNRGKAAAKEKKEKQDSKLALAFPA
jgi:uncharacterized protein YdhG (YjbR/CyaY superfamily)